MDNSLKISIDLVAVKVIKILSQHKKSPNQPQGFHYLSILVDPVPQVYCHLGARKAEEELDRSMEPLEIVLWNAIGNKFHMMMLDEIGAFGKVKGEHIFRFNNLLAQMRSKDDDDKISFHSCDRWHVTEWFKLN